MPNLVAREVENMKGDIPPKSKMQAASCVVDRRNRHDLLVECLFQQSNRIDRRRQAIFLVMVKATHSCLAIYYHSPILGFKSRSICKREFHGRHSRFRVADSGGHNGGCPTNSDNACCKLTTKRIHRYTWTWDAGHDSKPSLVTKAHANPLQTEGDICQLTPRKPVIFHDRWQHSGPATRTITLDLTLLCLWLFRRAYPSNLSAAPPIVAASCAKR